MRHLGYFLMLSTLGHLLLNLPAWGKQSTRHEAAASSMRSPASLHQLAPSKALGPSGAAQAILNQKPDFNQKPEKTTELKLGPRIELEEVRTMPRIGTLQPAFRYSDVTVKFR